MDSKLSSLYHRKDHYVESYKLFSTFAANFSECDKWRAKVFSEAVVPQLRITATLTEEDLRVLGVGSGSGETECMMLGQLLQSFPRINNRVVEPHQTLLVQYKALAQSKAHELQGVNFDWRQQTLEQYEKAGDLTKFHFISTIHSMYYVDDVDSSLMYLYNRLEPGGVLIVDIKSDDSGCYRFWDSFSPFHESYNYISSADIRRALDRRGMPYTQHHQPSRINITKCFDVASEDGSMVLDFICSVDKFKETAPEGLVRRVMERLASSDCSEKIGDEFFLNNDCDTIIISKPVE